MFCETSRKKPVGLRVFQVQVSEIYEVQNFSTH